jgi:hypothetical protein
VPFSAMSKVPSTPINLPATTNILICTVHEQLVGIGILHRDISIPNLALSCNSEHLPNQQCSADTPRAGILIDFDHATWLKEVDEVPLIPRKHEISNIDTVVCYVILSLWQMLMFLTRALSRSSQLKYFARRLPNLPSILFNMISNHSSASSYGSAPRMKGLASRENLTFWGTCHGATGEHPVIMVT